MTSQTPPTGPSSAPTPVDSGSKWYQRLGKVGMDAVSAVRTSVKTLVSPGPEWEKTIALGQEAGKKGKLDWTRTEALGKKLQDERKAEKAKDKPKKGIDSTISNATTSSNPTTAPASGVETQVNGVEKGVDAFEEVLKENPQAQLAVRDISILMALLKQDGQCNSDKKNSLLLRIGFNPDNLEQILQCAFHDKIDKIHARVGSDQWVGEMIMEDILGYKNASKVTIPQIRAKEGTGEPFQEVADRMLSFHQLKSRNLDNVGQFAAYLKQNNITLGDLDDELTQNGNLIQTLEGEINDIKSEIRAELTKVVNIKDPKVVAGLRNFKQEKEAEIEKRTKKIEILKMYKNLHLDQPQTPVEFDKAAVHARLEQLGLGKREVPKGYDWEPIVGNADTSFSLHLLEKIRTEMVRKADPDIMAVMHTIDPDKSLWRDIIHESPNKPIEALIYENCFDDGNTSLTEPITQDKIIAKIKEIAQALGAAFNKKKQPHGARQILRYIQRNNVSADFFEQELAQDPNLVSTWQTWNDDPANAAHKANTEEAVATLKAYIDFRNAKKTREQARINQIVNGLRADMNTKLELETLDDLRTALKNNILPRDQVVAALTPLHLEDAFVDDLMMENDSVESLIFKHSSDLQNSGQKFQPELVAKITAIKNALENIPSP